MTARSSQESEHRSEATALAPEASVVTVEVAQEGNGPLVVRLAGELDISSVGSVQDTLAPTVGERRPHLVFELSALEFLDSSGLALLLTLAKRAASVEVRHPSPTVRRVIELTGLMDVLGVTE